MKKLGIYSMLALGLVLLAGCDNQTTSVKLSELSDFYSNNHTMTCKVTQEIDWINSSFVIATKDNMLRQDIIQTYEWETYHISELIKDWVAYAWWDDYGENIWVSMAYDMEIWDTFKLSDEDITDDTVLTCIKWVNDLDIFELPSDIEFTSMDDLMLEFEDTDIDIEWEDEVNLEWENLNEEIILGENSQEDVEIVESEESTEEITE